jgi:hypothetical protein
MYGPERVVGQPEVIRFIRQAARWRDSSAVPSPLPISDPGWPESSADAPTSIKTEMKPEVYERWRKFVETPVSVIAR